MRQLWDQGSAAAESGLGLDPGHIETNWSKFRSGKAHPEGGTIGCSRVTGILELGPWLCSLPPELCTSALGQSTEAHSLYCRIPLPAVAGSLCCYCPSVHYTESSQQSFLCWTNSSSCFLKVKIIQFTHQVSR